MNYAGIASLSLSLPLVLALAACTGESNDAPVLSQQSADLLEAHATLTFSDDWSNTQTGDLVEGGRLVIDYDIDRLPQCFGNTYMGGATWNTNVYVKFDVTPVVTTLPLVGCDDRACSNPYSVAADLQIPAGTRHMELWVNSAGRSCGSHWDSAHGANYHYDVAAAPLESTSPAWLGDSRVRISRDSSAACEGGSATGEGWFFGTWARQRSVVSNVCFQAWQPGVTDFDNPNLWQELDTKVHYRFAADEAFAWQYVDLDQRVGNNARYKWNLRTIDPFFYESCPDVPTYVSNGFINANVEYYFSVNDRELRPDHSSSTFVGHFKDYDTSASCL